MARFLQCPQCGSVKCEIITEPQRKINWGSMLFSPPGTKQLTKTVLQQRGHCLECGCIW